MARLATYDPLEKFRFLVFLDGGVSRAGFHDCQTPKKTTTKISYREGIDANVTTQSAGLTAMEDVVLSRGLISGLTYDPTTGTKSGPADKAQNDLYNWVLLVNNSSIYSDPKGALSQGSTDYRKNVTIQMLDRDGNVARAWLLYNAWPTHFVSGSDLNAAEDADKSLESLTLAYEDFVEVTPPSAPGMQGPNDALGLP